MNDLTLALTGQLPFVILAAAVAAYPVSLALLGLYRRAVLRLMARGASPPRDVGIVARAEPVPAGAESLLVDLSAGAEATRAVPDLHRLARGRVARLGFAYALGGAAFAAVMVVAVLVSGDMAFLPVRVVLLFWIYAWPVAITVALVWAVTRWSRRLVVAVYFTVLAVLAGAALASSETLTIAQVATLWLITNAPPTVLILAFLARRIRAVGPLVITVMVMCFTGSVLALSAVGAAEPLQRALLHIGSGLGLGAYGVLATTVGVGFALFGLVGLLLLGWLRRAYLARRISDQSLCMDSLWLLFGVVQSIGFAFEGVWWILTGPAAFAAYKLVSSGAMRLLCATTHDGMRPRTLLLLRVFSLGVRSERLFDALTGYWRHIGSVQLIAGPDLATTTVEPHEFLSFLSGRLSSLFIDGEQTLDRRLARLDRTPDADGRHRIDDFFCHGNTWEMVLSRLVKDSDAVLMDLRAFSPMNAGCVRELEELVNTVDLGRVVLVVDDSTDLAYLEQTLGQAARGMRDTSPNRGAHPLKARIFRLLDPRSAAARVLLSHLALAADAPPA